MNALATSIYLVTGAGVVATPFIARTPRSIEAMLAELDEDLLHRIAWFADGPQRDAIEAFEIMEAIGGRLGLLRLLRQARLMTGITIETMKRMEQPAGTQDMKRLSRAMWRAVGACFFSPTAHAYRVAMIMSEMAGLQETALIEFDSARVGAEG